MSTTSAAVEGGRSAADLGILDRIMAAQHRATLAARAENLLRIPDDEKFLKRATKTDELLAAKERGTTKTGA